MDSLAVTIRFQCRYQRAQDQPLDKKRLQPCFDFRRTCDFKETLDGFLKITHSLLNRFPLASDIEFGTKSHVAAGFLGIQDCT
jgi:hypothetical protein